MIDLVGQVVAFLLFGLSLVIAGRVVHKAGYSPWWALLTFVPLANLIGLWVFAFLKWPGVDPSPPPGD